VTNPNGRILSNVRVARYNASTRAAVQGFADIEIDGKWRVNGVNLMRDGTIKPGQLTPLINNRRCYIPSIEILDPDLLESLTAAIRTAIHAHLETLPPDERVKPPRPPEPRKPAEPPGAVAANAKPAPGKATAKLQHAPVQAKPAPATSPTAPTKPKPVQTVSTKPAAEKQPSLPPPPRLLAHFPRKTL
jgi:hypothetical protein